MKRIAHSLLLLLLLLVGTTAQAQVPPAGSEFQINTHTTGLQRNPEVDMSPSGQFVAVWRAQNQDGDGDGVIGQRYDASGNPIGGEFVVNTTTASDQRIPDVKVHDDGSFVVVWESRLQDGDASTGVFGRRYDSLGGAIGSEFQVPSYTTGNQDAVSVDGTGQGDFVVVWRSRDEDGDGFGIFGRRFAGNGVAQGSAFLVNTYTTGDQNASAVSVDSAGRFVVVWQNRADDGVSSTFSVFAQRYASNGVTLGGDFQVDTYSIGDQVGMRVDHASNNDDFIVVWQSAAQDGSGGGIYAQRFDSGGATLGNELQINTYTTGDQEAPDIAVQDDGSFHVVWVSADASGDDGVSSQQFDSSGTALGGELQVNTYTPNNQSRPRIGGSGDGEFVVVWQSYLGQDGDSTGSFGQRFAVPPAPDLVVTTLLAPSTADSGETIPVEHTVRNAGDSGTGAFDVAFRLSANDICSTLDPLLGTRSIGALAAGADDGASTMVTIPGGTAANTMHLCVLADDGDDVAESDENNNARGAPIVIDALFADGFESGDTSAWSSAVK